MDSLSIKALHKLENYAKDFTVDYNYTKEKIKIFKNILPYLPEGYLETGSRSVIATEKILRVLEVIEFVNIESEVPIEPLEMEPVERAYKIVNTLQDEINNSNISKLGTALDIIVNKEKYKELVNIALEFISNKDALKDTNNISKLLKTFLGEGEAENNNLSKMLDILTMLEPGVEKKEQPTKD